LDQPHQSKQARLLYKCKDAAPVAFTEIMPGGIFDLPSNPLNLNPQRMFLDLSHQQDLGLFLFSYLKGIGTGDAFALRMDGQGQG
jgi:hypothetical protein